MSGIHDQADATSFKRFDGTVFATPRNRSEQTQSSCVGYFGRRVRNLVQSWSSTHGMGHLARGDAEGRSDCGEFRSRIRQLDNQFRSSKSTSSSKKLTYRDRYSYPCSSG